MSVACFIFLCIRNFHFIERQVICIWPKKDISHLQSRRNELFSGVVLSVLEVVVALFERNLLELHPKIIILK